jgi:hypothetical protein
MKDLSNSKEIPIGAMTELKDGKQIMLSPDEGGRLIYVQMVNS